MKYLILPVFTLVVFTATAQKIKPANTNDFVMECTKAGGELPNKHMVLWIPYDFWEIVGEQMKTSPGYTQQIVNEMKNYMMFAVVDYNVSTGGVVFKSEDDIRSSIKLYDSAKNVYKPIAKKDIAPNAAQVINNLQPIMAQMLGQFGEGMAIVLFESKKVMGKPVIDVAKPNHFTLSWGRQT